MVNGRFSGNFMVAARNPPYRSLPCGERSWIRVALQTGVPDGRFIFIIFLSFGLIAPRNALALVTLTPGALSIASAIYVIVDLDSLVTGPIAISSQPMRDALEHLKR